MIVKLDAEDLRGLVESVVKETKKPARLTVEGLRRIIREEAEAMMDDEEGEMEDEMSEGPEGVYQQLKSLYEELGNHEEEARELVSDAAGDNPDELIEFLSSIRDLAEEDRTKARETSDGEQMRIASNVYNFCSSAISDVEETGMENLAADAAAGRWKG